MTWTPPVGTFAIWRIAPMVPIVRRSFGCGIVLVVDLQREKNQPVAAERAIDGVDRQRPVDRQRLERQRKDDSLSKREDRKLARVA